MQSGLHRHLLTGLLLALFLWQAASPIGHSSAQENGFELVPIKQLGGRGVPVDLQWSPDGSTVAISSGQSVWLYTQDLQDVRAMQLHTVENLQLFESVSAGQLAWSPDGSMLAGGSGFFVPSVRGRFAYIWDAATGDILQTFERGESINMEREAARQVAWSPDGSMLAGFSRTEFWVWDVATGDTLINETHDYPLFDDFRWVAEDNTLRILDTRALSVVSWDAATGEFANNITIRNTDNIAFITSPDERLTAKIDTSTAQIFINDDVSGETLRTFGIIAEQRLLPLSGVWSADSSKFVSYVRTRQPQVQIWDVETGREVFFRQFNDNASIEVIGLNTDNQTLALGIVPGILEVWDIASGEQISSRWAGVGSVNALDWHPDGSHIVSVSNNDTTVRVWDAQTGDPLMALEAHQGWIYSVDWSPDGSQIASGDGSTGIAFPSTVRLWDAISGDELAVIPIESDTEDFGFIRLVKWSPDGTKLGIIRDSNTTGRTKLRVYDVNADEMVFAIDPERARINPIEWQPDSTQLIGSVAAMNIPLLLDDGTQTASALMRFDLEADDLVQEVATDEFSVQLGWQPGGDLLVSAESGRDNRLSFWDGRTGEFLFATDLQPERYTALAWHPSGEWLAVATFASLVRPIIEIWQVQPDRAERVATLDGHVSFGTGITALSWSADGRYLASAADDGKILIWRRQ